MGRMMAEFPLGPQVHSFDFTKANIIQQFAQLSKALIESVRLRSADKMLTIAAMLSGEQPDLS
jgi:hypothetical protein